MVLVRRSTAVKSTSPRLEAVCTHHQAPERAGQHQQAAEADEAHADDGRRRARAERDGDGDRDGADRREADSERQYDQRTAVGGRDERHASQVVK